MRSGEKLPGESATLPMLLNRSSRLVSGGIMSIAGLRLNIIASKRPEDTRWEETGAIWLEKPSILALPALRYRSASPRKPSNFIDTLASSMSSMKCSISMST